MWFNKNHLIKYRTIKIDDLHGYVLPHAGTLYTGNIISHTLRFKPKKDIKYIYIIYYPSNHEPNIGEYYHEYYVPMKCLEHFFNDKIKYIGINIRESTPKFKLNKNSIVVVSADFSHHLPMQEGINLENKAAHSIMFRNLDDNIYNNIIDDKLSFRYLYDNININYQFQWIGRSRSDGIKGVGYLSFLLREKPNMKYLPDGFFVTVYDNNMNSRECLGHWFNKRNKWNKNFENNFIIDTCDKASKTSRLTNGTKLNIPISNEPLSNTRK